MLPQPTSRRGTRPSVLLLVLIALAGCDYQKHYGLTDFHGIPTPALHDQPPSHADTQYWDKRAAHDHASSGSSR